MSKDSAHHLIGNVFTNTRTLRDKTTIEFNDIPVLLLGFTALLREHASIFALPPFSISAKDHRVDVRKYSFRFNTPLSRDEEIFALDHLCKIIRGEKTYKCNSNGNKNVVEQDMDLSLDVTEVDKPVAIQLNHQMALSIYQAIVQNTKLELTMHFSALFVARSEITFGSTSLYRTNGVPTLTEILETISLSGKLNTKNSPKPHILWNILRKFRINLLSYDDQIQHLHKPTSTPQKFSIVDAMHGAVHYKDHTYWRFSSNWYLVSSDRLAVIQHKFRKLLQSNLMSDLNPAYLSKKFPMPALNESDSGSSSNSQPSTSTADINQASQRGETSLQQSGRDYLEHDYNCSYATEAEFLVGDKITANNIEIFDLLRYDEDRGSGTVWIYHVKRKFGQCTRDAISQLAMSATLIHDDIMGSGEKSLHKHYAQLVEKDEIKEKLIAWGITGETDYVNFFRKNKLIFVYAFVDEDNKSTKRTLIEESGIKSVVTIEDLIEKLELYKRQINDHTNFQSIVHQMYRLVFDLDTNDLDVENLELVAKHLFQFLVKAKLIGPDGKVTGKLLFGINFNQLGSISVSAFNFQTFSLRFYAKINFFEFILKSYRSLYQTLIAKIELQRIHRFILEKGFDFQICEIGRENGGAPMTPITKVAIKRDSSGSNSSRKRQNISGSSSKKKAIPKGQPLITQRFSSVSRNLSQDLNAEFE